MNYDRVNIVGGGNSSGGIRIITVGDIMLAREVGEKIRQSKSSTFLTEKVGKIFDSADIVLGNLESPISETATKTRASSRRNGDRGHWRGKSQRYRALHQCAPDRASHE